jgi:hypothetical protein
MKVQELAQKYDLSESAVTALYQALVAGKGRAAQFNHPELGGIGQWMPGMTMIGDMMNHSLKAKIERFCIDLAPSVQATASTNLTGSVVGSAWWGAELGSPAQEGAQNNIRYAHFPAKQRLAVEQAGKVTLYDTGSLTITGIAAANQQLQFNTDQGVKSLSDFNTVQSDEAGA